MVFQEFAFWYQPVWCPRACAQPEVTILHLGGALVPIEDLSDMHCCVPHLWRKQDTGPLLQYCFFPRVLTDLNSSCWNSGKVMEDENLLSTKRKLGTRKYICSWEGPTGPTGIQSLFSLIILNLWGTGVGQGRE